MWNITISLWWRWYLALIPTLLHEWRHWRMWRAQPIRVGIHHVQPYTSLMHPSWEEVSCTPPEESSPEGQIPLWGHRPLPHVETADIRALPGEFHIGPPMSGPAQCGIPLCHTYTHLYCSTNNCYNTLGKKRWRTRVYQLFLNIYRNWSPSIQWLYIMRKLGNKRWVTKDGGQVSSLFYVYEHWSPSLPVIAHHVSTL